MTLNQFSYIFLALDYFYLSWIPTYFKALSSFCILFYLSIYLSIYLSMVFFLGGGGGRAGGGWRVVVASSRNYFLSLIGKMLIAYTNRSIAMGVLPLYRTPGP